MYYTMSTPCTNMPLVCISAKGEDAWEESWDGTQDIDIEGKLGL